MCDVPKVRADSHWLGGKGTATPYQSYLSLTRHDLFKKCPLRVDPVTLQSVCMHSYHFILQRVCLNTKELLQKSVV